MEIFIALAVIATIQLGVLIMTLARLAAAAAAISSGVARIGTEVTETTAAIRAHLEGDSGISQSALLAEVEKLEAAGAALTESANALDSLQTELGANPGDGAETPASDISAGSDVPAADGLGGEPASEEPAASVDPAVTGDAADDSAAGGLDDGSGFGNQNGIGSDFEQGAGGDRVDLNSQSDGDQPDGDDSQQDDSADNERGPLDN